MENAARSGGHDGKLTIARCPPMSLISSIVSTSEFVIKRPGRNQIDVELLEKLFFFFETLKCARIILRRLVIVISNIINTNRAKTLVYNLLTTSSVPLKDDIPEHVTSRQKKKKCAGCGRVSNTKANVTSLNIHTHTHTHLTCVK